jgi:hypothetical protein
VFLSSRTLYGNQRHGVRILLTALLSPQPKENSCLKDCFNRCICW